MILGYVSHTYLDLTVFLDSLLASLGVLGYVENTSSTGYLSDLFSIRRSEVREFSTQYFKA